MSKVSKFFYLLKFDSRQEMLRVLRQGNRNVFGDIVILHPWHPFLNPRTFSMNSEVFEIVLHNLTHSQTRFLNVKHFSSELGDPIYVFPPLQSSSGFSSMSIRLRINLSQPLIFGTYAPNNVN